jgi:hypothetical protein
MKLSKSGKTVNFEVKIWWNPKDRKIRLESKESRSFILTVSNEPSKKNDPSKTRYHPKLFRELTKILRAAGAPGPE